jgi:hypothetical protein
VNLLLDHRGLRAVKRLSRFFLFAALFLFVVTPTAQAAFGLKSFDVTFQNGAGETEALAGSHPFEMKTAFEVNTEEIEGQTFPQEQIKDFEATQVPGFVGDTGAAPKCQTVDFLQKANGINNATKCSNSTVLGFVHLEVAEGIGVLHAIQNAPLYNLEPTPGSAARLGFNVASTPVTLTIGTAEEFPYQVIAHTRNISQILEFFSAEVTVWGVPADHAHDSLRGSCLAAAPNEETGGPISEGICEAGENPRPFLTLPRACEGPLRTEYEMDSWQHPGVWVEGFAETHDNANPPNPQGMSGCGSLGFNPTAQATPSTEQAESSAGMEFEIAVADEGLKSAEGRANADIEALEIAFPTGLTANPSAAEGLGVCSLSQYEEEALETPAGAGCPEAAKLGTIEAETPILPEHPLHGSMFLASQTDNPFGSLLALYTVIRDPELGVFVKFATEVETDEKTGQLVAFSEELPPYPLSQVKVSLRPGPRAPFITPPSCDSNPSLPGNNPYVTEATLFPSSGAEPLISTSTFQITSGPGGAPCPAANLPFHAGFEASSVNNAAGAYSPFKMRLTRQDGDQDITRFSATLPPGVTGKIAGIAKCSDAQIARARARSAPGQGRLELADPSCPAASLLGHVLTGAGVGTALTYVPGFLYLAGPFGGDPLSVVAIVPAVAGPFDVGTVVTRVALTLNPLTGQVEVDGRASEPIPHILHGIPLKVRDLRIATDRPNFTLNPTSCSVFATQAQIVGGGNDPFSSADDVPLGASSRYQASSCASLAFHPTLALSLKGGTKRAKHPALHAVLTYPKGNGYANTGKIVTTLPRTEFIDNAHINNPCTRVQFDANQCPPSSVLGTARAVTPLLDEPLEGLVYFRSNGGERKLPDVVIDLRGLFHIILVGKVDTATPKTNPRIRTTFDEVPDAPVQSFELNLFGGKRGLLVNSANLCSKKRRAVVEATGKNGRRHDTEPVVKTSCKGHKRRG